MRIDGQLPMHIAQAYGISRVAPLRGPRPTVPSQPVHRTHSAQNAARPGAIGAERLVAGRVAGQIEFNGSSTRDPNNTGSLQLYTRAADKLEAAIGVHLGRAIDLRG